MFHNYIYIKIITIIQIFKSTFREKHKIKDAENLLICRFR